LYPDDCDLPTWLESEASGCVAPQVNRGHAHLGYDVSGQANQVTDLERKSLTSKTIAGTLGLHQPPTNNA
jgi:hypothetical protein